MKIKKHLCWHCRKPVDNVLNVYEYQCPHCGSLFADKPKNEAILHILQLEYLKTRDKKIFSKMMLNIQDIAYNQICAKLKKTGKFLVEEDLEDHVQWTLCKMIKLYSKPEFKINSSFIEYIGNVVLYPLYNYKTQDIDQNEISLFTPINGTSSNNKKESTLYDVMKEETILESTGEVENFFFNKIEEENVIHLTNDFISTIANSMYKKKGFGYSLKMVSLLEFYLMEKNNKLFTNWWNIEGLEFKKVFEKVLLLFRNSLRESLCE